MLSSAFPSIRHASPGNIHEVEVPELKNVVVVDDTNSKVEWEKETVGFRSLVDFRNILIWDEGSIEGEKLRNISTSLNKDDIVNLQFTRCVDTIYISI
jgi:hypothetical protein